MTSEDPDETTVPGHDPTAPVAGEETRRRGGRPPAGTDPVKRRQIVEGAGRVFSGVGYDAASMNDVARAADVSKATLYVYYQSKEELFAAVCSDRRERSVAELVRLLEDDAPLDVVLDRFGRALVGLLSTPFVISAQRIVLGVVERMPEIGQDFYLAGAHRLADELAEVLARHEAEGRLRMPDARLAAVQFLELCQATIHRPRLYGATTTPPTEAEIEKVVGSAVHMLLAAYGTPKR